MRFERKYIIANNMSWKFRDMLLKKNFKKVFLKRKVNSLYFDTHDYLFFRENIEGIGKRVKTRVRWYKNHNDKEKKTNKYFIEIKKKEGFLGTKDIYKIDLKHDIENSFSSYTGQSLLEKISSLTTKIVKPILITSYDREYFLSSDKKLRATIDTNLTVKKFKHKFIIPLDKEIMEMKYNNNHDSYYRNLIIDSNFKFRFQKYSKYVTGVLKLKANGVI